jgi:hypothetical protein
VDVRKGSWEDFEDWLRGLRATYSNHSSPLLFRGQANSEWSLSATLERQGKTQMRLIDFYRLIASIGPAVETLTGEKVPEYDPDLVKTFDNAELFNSANPFPSGAVYRYMVYLRHHGFPSPLIDWSRSPYVAAFFAFRYASDAPMRSIFVYCERPMRVKGWTVGEPTINSLGPYIRSHQRHFRQQST